MAKVIQRVFELKDRFTPQMQKIKQSQWQYQRDVRKLKRVGTSAFRGLAKGVMAFGAAAAGAGVGVAAIAKQTANAGDEVDKISQRLSMGRKEYQEWKHVIDQTGVSLSTFERAAKNNRNAMIQASNGTAAAQEAYAKLGMELKNTDESLRNQQDVFEETIYKLSQYEDSTERAKIAQRLLGDNASKEFAPLLNSGAESIEALREEAHELGMVMSDSAIDMSIKFNDQLDRLKKVGTGAFRQLGVVALPYFTNGLEWAMKAVPQIRDFAVGMFNRINEILEENRQRIDNIKSVFYDVRDSVVDTFGSSGSGGGALNWFTNTALPMTVAGILSVLDTASKMYFFIRDNWSRISPLVYGIVGALSAYYLMTKAVTMAKFAMTAAQVGLNAAMMMSPVGWLALGIGALIVAGVALVKNWDDVKLAGKSLWNAIVGFAEAGVNGFLGAVDALLGGVLKGINGTIKQLNKIPGVDISTVDSGVGRVDFGAAKANTAGKEFSWKNNKRESASPEMDFGDQLAKYEKEQEINFNQDKTATENLAKELKDNTETMKSTRGGGNNFEINVYGTDLTAEEIADKLVPRIERKLFA
ncbi:phage tail tape measure protein [Tindallia californiensis]|uniref:Phage tail tape measure protein, TP901 family, core region n=1 Tax=Tindallia californiensis TaxID=159292 RepID=A0A1H3R274_9FIRM|nr:hypothetical protein [Tindallia californiensis]SDZ19401.1 hypothetical protein SAMN05192546_11180 [Tindallia californiensis]